VPAELGRPTEMPDRRPGKDPVALALIELMTDWNGGSRHGIVINLSRLIAARSDESERATANKLYRGLEGQPSWELVTQVVKHCAPDEAPAHWQEGVLQELASLWYRSRGTEPAGYIGSITDGNGRTVRQPLTSVQQTRDLATRAALLESQLQQARAKQAELLEDVTGMRSNATYFDEMAHQLHAQLNLMRTDTEELRSFARDQIQPLREQVNFLNNRVQQLQVDVGHAERRAVELTVENGQLQDQRRRAERELDTARADGVRLSIELHGAQSELEGASREVRQLRERLEQLEQQSDGAPPYRMRNTYNATEIDQTWRFLDADDVPPPVIGGEP
jgi:hypothetical protein